jgi:hypothetical protein
VINCPQVSAVDPRNIPSAPILSVLIPAFEYPNGILRILDAIADSASTDIECIICDDSNSDVVEQAVKSHCASDRVLYRRNKPPLGAIRNWNNLLQSACGQFVMVLHHDECPVHPNFFVDLCELLSNTTDALILDCFIGIIDRGRMRRHFPLQLKTLVLRYFPMYLLRRNLLGGPSVLVVRRDRILPFDSRIPIMVDVEWYCRLMRQPGFQVRVTSALALLSVHHQGSITKSFGGAVSEMIRLESALLRAENPSLNVLALAAPRNISEYLFGVVESIGWGVIRSVTLLIDSMRAQPIPARLLRIRKL